jgi:hypothetical protein
MRWTDQRIASAAGHHTLPDLSDSFPRSVSHNTAASYLAVAQLAFRGGLAGTPPSTEFVRQRYGDSGPRAQHLC